MKLFLTMLCLILILNGIVQKESPKSSMLISKSALLLTSSNSISFLYSKEMGYEKDFVQTVFKINETVSKSRIEDAVYDNITCSIYFSIFYDSSINYYGNYSGYTVSKLIKLTRPCKQILKEDVSICF